ncbi:P-loop containing nucleoside triphosphate hydrolases superfamily protein [Actinidia rufa]|uniref:P-loop containing nucleoside triphosphate hydrolases superfamily protein n=1 Tax=Actinidia rufa TaxID=165716 RepID=A0A7J0G829_9ERIC|nr:P-loop containing nucleoside triphosphate hydrolases superfamily protein [Actinidia rufa]
MNPHLEVCASKNGEANGLTEAYNGNDTEEIENKFLIHLKQECYADLPAGKISELMKLNSLKNSPTQSLFSVVNKVLDDIIERKNGDIPHKPQLRSSNLIVGEPFSRNSFGGRSHCCCAAATSPTSPCQGRGVDESEVLLAASEDGKSDWVLDSGSAYHLCRDRKVFSTYAACEGRIWMANNTASRVVGKGSVRFRMTDERSVTLTEVRHVPNLRTNLISIGMLDAKGCNFEASGGILRVSKGNKEMLWGKKIGGFIPIGGNVQTGGATVRHGSSGISVKSGQGKQPLHRGTQSKRREEGYQVNFEKLYSEGAPTPKRVSFALDLISGGVLSSCAHKGGEMEPRQLAKVTYFAAHPGGGCGAPQWGVQGISDAVLQSYEGAGSEVVRKDNLKTSDYPPVGWRGRLLSPAHLDKSKPLG